MLAVPDLNPVQVVCSIIKVSPSWVATVALVTFLGIVYANGREMAYFATKVFFQSILNIFFSSIEVLGKENIPAHGPIIFTGNHMNQFVDGAMVLVTNPHRVSFLVAESSFSKPIIGDFSKAVGALPVKRAMDSAKKGPGKICLVGMHMYGEGTSFKSIIAGDKGDRIRPGRSPDAYKVKEVLSDTELLLVEEVGEKSPLQEKTGQGKGNWVDYDVLGFVDQRSLFDAVFTGVSKGQSICIFPEGGSHDNPDLLPFKVGVSVIAFGTLDRHDIHVPIVPIGLTYFRGDRFRGRVVVEFGAPIHITKELEQLYKQSKRDGYQALLHQVEDGIRSVIITAPNYETLSLIHTARRLYQRADMGITIAQKQDLARRFAAAYRLMQERNGGKLPDDLRELQAEVEEYQRSLSAWGIYDYQVANLDVPFSRLLYTFLHGAVVMTLASIPSLILNAPVGLLAKYWAHTEAEKDQKKSRVKNHGAKDVLMSKKIVFSIIAVPILWVTYVLLLILFSPLEMRTIIVLFLCCPIFSYIGVRSVEAGMVDLKDLRPGMSPPPPHTFSLTPPPCSAHPHPHPHPSLPHPSLLAPPAGIPPADEQAARRAA
jgi:glycerol-3-phosphate O-acyltransferase/dihydroxyacetone phosphate acyltransferase